MKEIVLHGALAEEFGSEPIVLDVPNVAAAFHALKSRFGPKFHRMIEEGKYWLVRDDVPEDEDLREHCNYVSEHQLHMSDPADVVHVIPYVEGSGGKGFAIGKIILGVILVVVSFWCGGCTAMMGIGLIASGISDLMAPSPRNTDPLSADRDDQQPSFQFNGVTNTVEQGGPVPLLFGTLRVGSTVVSAGADVERTLFAPPPPPPEETPPPETVPVPDPENPGGNSESWTPAPDSGDDGD